jgi:UDP-N-acetylglucosamine 4,6-dehydratase
MSTKCLITGGAGFLGRAILRRVEQKKLNWDITVFSRDEMKQDVCRQRYPDARYVLGDVRDMERLYLAMVGQDIVIHAAAMKYIPHAELNAAECVAVNVDGTRNVIRAAREAKVSQVIGVSTDKAVQPVNVYGMTKAIMERMFAEAGALGTQYNCVRYGNVIGSTGSAIPMFRRQLKELGKILITNPNMTRFWMSADEAVGLINIALLKARPGAIVVPPVRAMRIGDVALAAVGECEVEVIGDRPGEKLHEELIHFQESVRVVRHGSPMFFELLPPGNTIEGVEPFTLASHTPNFWLEIKEMRKLIEDAEAI